MESPAAPSKVDCYYEIKQCVMDLANDLNKGGDGIFATVARIGTGVAVTLHIPDRTGKLTFIKSLQEAQSRLGWPKK